MTDGYMARLLHIEALRTGSPWSAAECERARQLCFKSCLACNCVDDACDAVNSICLETSYAVWEPSLPRAREELAGEKR